MKRVVIGAAAALGIGLIVGACDDGGRGFRHRHGELDCGQFSSCDTCTPVLGCGWCFTGSGTGTCTDGPSDCSTASSGGWTWEPSGCHVIADAAVGVTVEGGAEAATTDAGSGDAPASMGDAGEAGDGP